MAQGAPVTINLEGDVHVAHDRRKQRNYMLLGALLSAVFIVNTIDQLVEGSLLSLLPQLGLAALFVAMTVLFFKQWREKSGPAITLSPDGFVDARVSPNRVAWADVQDISYGKAAFGTKWLELLTGARIAKAHHTGRTAQLLSSNPNAVFVDVALLDIELEDAAELFSAFWNYHAPQHG